MKQEENNGDWRQALGRYRAEINGVDEQIISLLSRRQTIAIAIGQIKRDLGLEVLDPAREKEVLRRLTSKNLKNLNKETISHIFNEIISSARSVQEPLSVAFLGPDATFSHQAAISVFGRSVSFRAVETIEDVFSMVEKGICRQGVVPIENSYEGAVHSTMDLLYKYDLKISSEVFLRIRHNLLSKSDSISKIKCLYSHPMPVAQCRSWIKNHLSGIRIREVGSTSLAARAAADDPESAAVGSRLSATVYGLNMLEENIEDRPDNVTRFLVIGKMETAPTGKDKTSILFFLNDKSGALYKALESLVKRNINMTRIESRPMKTRNWEYLFFADIEGHEQDMNVHDAIKEMEERCAFLKRLGSFPSGDEPWS